MNILLPYCKELKESCGIERERLCGADKQLDGSLWQMWSSTEVLPLIIFMDLRLELNRESVYIFPGGPVSDRCHNAGG